MGHGHRGRHHLLHVRTLLDAPFYHLCGDRSGSNQPPHPPTHPPYTTQPHTPHSPPYLVDGATDTPVSAAAAKAAALEQQQRQQQQQQQAMGQHYLEHANRTITPPHLPTPKHAPLPATMEGVPAHSLLTVGKNSQPILVIPPPPTIKKARRKRWMKIEGQ